MEKWMEEEVIKRRTTLALFQLLLPFQRRFYLLSLGIFTQNPLSAQMPGPSPSVRVLQIDRCAVI